MCSPGGADVLVLFLLTETDFWCHRRHSNCMFLLLGLRIFSLYGHFSQQIGFYYFLGWTNSNKSTWDIICTSVLLAWQFVLFCFFRVDLWIKSREYGVPCFSLGNKLPIYPKLIVFKQSILYVSCVTHMLYWLVCFSVSHNFNIVLISGEISCINPIALLYFVNL